MTPEGKVKKKVRSFLNMNTAIVWHFFPVTGGFGVSGVPDIVGCAYGRFFGIECKAGKGQLTDLQKAQQYRIEACGGKYWVVDDLTVEAWPYQFSTWLDQMRRQERQ